MKSPGQKVKDKQTLFLMYIDVVSVITLKGSSSKQSDLASGCACIFRIVSTHEPHVMTQECLTRGLWQSHALDSACMVPAGQAQSVQACRATR
jgi:hypothetical protein